MNGAHPTESTPPTSSHGRGARTSGPRLEAVDALRALALLGILSVNVWYFLYPGLLESGIRSTPVESAADQLVRFTSTLLFEAKSYVVFSFLFGLSFVLAWASAARAGLSEVRRSVRRFVALIVLGVLHGMFLFAGDILLAYAILGFALLGMRRISTRWALIIAAGVLLLWSGFTLVTGLAASALEGTAEGTDLWDESVVPVSDPESARQAYTGGLGSYLGFQLSVYPMIAANMFFGQGPMAFAAFLIGLVVGRSQLIERIIGRQIATTTLLAWTLPALAVGLGLSGTAAVMLWGPPGSTAPAAATAENMMGAELTAMGMLFSGRSDPSRRIRGAGAADLPLRSRRSAGESSRSCRTHVADQLPGPVGGAGDHLLRPRVRPGWSAEPAGGGRRRTCTVGGTAGALRAVVQPLLPRAGGDAGARVDLRPGLS